MEKYKTWQKKDEISQKTSKKKNHKRWNLPQDAVTTKLSFKTTCSSNLTIPRISYNSIDPFLLGNIFWLNFNLGMKRNIVNKLNKNSCTYCEHMLTRSLSVVEGLRPRMYKLVFESCSELVVVAGMLLLKDVGTVPLWLPVWLLELLVLLGEAAVGTLGLPYCKRIEK